MPGAAEEEEANGGLVVLSRAPRIEILRLRSGQALGNSISWSVGIFIPFVPNQWASSSRLFLI